ncbi:unnamed protein product [Linum tenue]|uniref:GOLD domain-containing protein n=1 Tax=Linum tenue TaxID=586396 RepID=A0AAV0JJ02_9ROSI|nr:unnamed protein product [Linum tenue]
MVASSFPAARGIWLSIPSSGTKCVSEEIHSNVVVLADYYVINEEKPEHVPKVSSRVTSPYGTDLHHQENATHGQFAFTTSEAGNYMACFWLDEHQEHVANVSLGLEWKTGIAAKDWDSVAKKEKIEASLLSILYCCRFCCGDLVYLRVTLFLYYLFIDVFYLWCRVLSLT